MHPFLSEVMDAIERRGLFPPETGCVVAVSGGADSMLLLEAMTAFVRSRGGGRRCVVAHFNHRLRGTAADAEQAMVAGEAAKRGLPFVADSVDVRAAARGASLEVVARRLRHDFLARAARTHACSRIATGHHADDQVEGVLMRWLRGSGSRGLAGMSADDPSPVDPAIRLIRPLLPFERAAVRAAASELGLRWCEDSTNADTGLFRNRIRHELVPLLVRDYQPALTRVVSRTAAVLRDEAEFIRAAAASWLQGAERDPFRELPAALQREILRMQLEAAGVPVSFDLVETLRRDPPAVVQVGGARRVARTRDGCLAFLPVPEREPFRDATLCVDVCASAGAVAFGGLEIEWNRLEADGRIPVRTAGEERFDADVVGGVVTLRHWSPGDRFQPIGMPAPVRLQDLFVNARVPADERRRRVLASDAGGRIFWVEGLRIGEACRVRPGTGRLLVWRWRRSG